MTQRAMTTAQAWNWCPLCAQLVDADDVHDGSEVRCLGCKRWYVCVAFGDGEHWELHPVELADEAES